MGNRNFGGREKKKLKKNAKKQSVISSALEEPKQEVEVIRKVRKPRETEEE